MHPIERYFWLLIMLPGEVAWWLVTTGIDGLDWVGSRMVKAKRGKR